MFPIVPVERDARDQLEQVGSKEKFWYRRSMPDAEADGGEQDVWWLFKRSRWHAGEDWSEKIAAELCALLGLPHATYELATWNDARGIVTKRVHDDDERFVHGDELLAHYFNRYKRAPREGFYINPEYTLDCVFEVLNDPELNLRVDPAWSLPPAARDAPSVFVGYLMLDAWIGNTDRHDQNWAVIVRETAHGPMRTLAPTFDHASCLGRELADSKRRAKLNSTAHAHAVEGYLEKCMTRFVRAPGTRDRLHVHEVFTRAADRYPRAAAAWLDRLARLDLDADVHPLFDAVPADRITPLAARFAQRVLALNREALLAS
jgi:hypothetical protein